MADSLAALGSSADVMALIAASLERVVRHNHDLRQSQPTSFDAVAAPAISVHRYLARIRQYTKFHDECYIVALVYLDRLFRAHKAPFLPTQHNVHRLVITSVLVASKFYDGACAWREAIQRARAPAPTHPPSRGIGSLGCRPPCIRAPAAAAVQTSSTRTPSWRRWVASPSPR